MTKYLVWIVGLRGPEPQLWYDKQVDGTGKAKKYLSIHEIADDDRRDLKQLANIYPAPEIEAK